MDGSAHAWNQCGIRREGLHWEGYCLQLKGKTYNVKLAMFLVFSFNTNTYVTICEKFMFLNRNVDNFVYLPMKPGP